MIFFIITYHLAIGKIQINCNENALQIPLKREKMIKNRFKLN